MKLGLTATGLKEARAANARRVRALDPKNELGAAVKRGTLRYYYKMFHVVHRQSGALAAALRVDLKITARTATGRVFIDPGARKPGSKTPPAEYGVYENARGGAHAFIDIAAKEIGFIEQQAASEMEKTIADAK